MGNIFVSYSHHDSDYAHRLAENLERAGFSVWIDARIDYGTSWPREIQKQLDDCEAFIVIMTPQGFASEWVQSELQRAKRKNKYIFPMLLEGDEPWLSTESTQYYDVRDGKLPGAEFYAAMRQASTRAVTRLPGAKSADARKPATRSRSSDNSGGRIAVIVAGIGAIATLLSAVIPLIWSNLSNRAPSAPDQSTAPAEQASVPDAPVDTGGSVTVQGSAGVPMLLVPAGEFTMGREVGDRDEGPAHTVYLDDYYVDTYEVTNGFYAACVDAGACQPPQDDSSATRNSYFGNAEFEDFPVLYVDWAMAKRYCEWRGAQLPTEAQWEKAARGSDDRQYPWGDSFSNTLANNGGDLGDTAAVGSYEGGKSPYGIYDMAGNVWEWVADWYTEQYDTSVAANPTGPDSGEGRVLRGGAWDQDDFSVRVSYRLNADPSDVYYTFGFRCASDSAP